MGSCSSDSIQDKNPTGSNRGVVHELKMTTYIDQRSKLRLLNYESKKFHKHTYHLINDCIVFKGDNQKKIIQETFKTDENKVQNISFVNGLFNVYKKHNYFKITPFNFEKNEQIVQTSLWLVVRSIPQKKYHLRQKDILKLGLQKIKVRQIIHEDHHLHNSIINLSNIKTKKRVYSEVKYLNNDQENKQVDYQIKSIQSQSDFTCRICLEPGLYTNPLICPCKCSGSVRYIHIKCLRQWLTTRLNIQQIQNCIIVKWTPLSCEICRSHFKYRVFLDNIKYYTLQIPKPVKPYVVLQFIGKTSQFSKIFMFLSFSRKRQMTFGRTKASDIRINESTISRYHANIFYDQIQKKFYLTDNESRFGTFVYVKNNIIINPHQKHLSFQIGGQLYCFQALRKKEPFYGFHQQQRYINVIQKGSEDILSQQSSENQQQHEQFEDDISSQQQQAINQLSNQQQKLHSKFSNISSLPTSNNLQQIDQLQDNRNQLNRIF